MSVLLGDCGSADVVRPQRSDAADWGSSTMFWVSNDCDSAAPLAAWPRAASTMLTLTQIPGHDPHTVISDLIVWPRHTRNAWMSASVPMVTRLL